MANSQGMLGTPEELGHYCSRGSFVDYLETESISERLTKIPGKNLGPRCSDVERAVNKEYSHGVRLAALGAKRPLFRQLNTYSATTNRTCPQRTSGSSQSGGYSAQPASRQVKAGTSSNARQSKKRRKNNSDGDNGDDDERTPSGSKEPANSKGDGPNFACPFLKKFPHSSLQCGGRDGFPNTSRVKEHIYRAHDKYQCRRCGITFEQDDRYEVHVRTNSCAPPSPPEHVPVLIANRKKLGLLRNREGLQYMSERDRWHKIYKLLFPEVTKEELRQISPYVEEHAEHRVQEAPQQPQAIHQQQQEVPQQQQISAQLQQFFQQSLQPLQGIQQQMQVLSQQMRESQQASQALQNQLAGHEAWIQAQGRASDDFSFFTSVGSQFSNLENSSVGNQPTDDGLIDPRFLWNPYQNDPSTGSLI
ncbi:uncharacterized protein F4812DRAFT_454861 [Daldinia caldariorum]|uniref:uncharacterized protein n=1 Tax=Daldinia caldariorum TaxID=326644 RepID=UPI002008A9AE|nr:uncharacterized protein F4812DRAFT_454861 [Daldinia caldariorum]KAI1473042.1 hypothetical protein F4812DRAFT_454861 [Daldinia caldariorum]